VKFPEQRVYIETKFSEEIEFYLRNYCVHVSLRQSWKQAEARMFFVWQSWKQRNGTPSSSVIIFVFFADAWRPCYWADVKMRVNFLNIFLPFICTNITCSLRISLIYVNKRIGSQFIDP